MLKVLFICPTVASYIGGTETVVSQFSQQLKGRVHLTVLSGDSGSADSHLFNSSGLHLINIPFAGRGSKMNSLLSNVLMTSPFKIESRTFFQSLSKSGIDLSAFDCIATFYEMDAYLLSRRFPHLKDRMKHFLPGVSIRRFFRHVPPQNVYFLGYRAAPRAKRKWGVDIPSLPLGVDLSFFPEIEPVYPEKKLIYFGRLDNSKNVDWLTDFFVGSGLAARGYTLEIVGDGPLFESLQAKHGKSQGIHIHGRKRHDEVIELLRQSLLLLHPTGLESFGLTILEAMAAGVPVVTHDLESIRIWAGDYPRYADFLDASSWLSAIEKFEDPIYWKEISSAGITFARQFTWERVSSSVLAIMRGESTGPKF